MRSPSISAAITRRPHVKTVLQTWRTFAAFRTCRRRRWRYEMLEIETTQRAAVVAEARRWIGTPFHNCADIRGVGVDCGMLIVRVFVDAGLCPPFDPRPYPPDWHLHRSEERYLGFVFDRCAEATEEDARPGDVIVFKYGRCYSHGGIVTKSEPLTFIHAFNPARRVVEEQLRHNEQLSQPRHARRFFSLWKARSALR